MVMTVESRSSSRRLAWLQLMRLPNVFTAMADVLMGFWLTHETLSPIVVILLLLAASSCLYIGGMVLNDVCDLEQDRRERPHRPLPSGRIPLKFAPLAAFSLLILGAAAGCSAAFMVGDSRPAEVAVALEAAIFSYDARFKSTFAGPILMGTCRMLNVLLGMSASSQPWSNLNWAVVIGIGLYIAGVTWFARREAASSKRAHLTAATVTMLAGMAVLWYWPRLVPSAQLFATLQFEPGSWTLVWILIAMVIGSRFAQAIVDPQPSRVQAAVKTGILSIIVLDAVTVFALRGPGPSIAILFLIVPTMALGAWVYST
jgi:4-hydroxybenzoate polyprenyltransferase